MRIAELAKDRNNNFNLIRFLAATAVLFAHSYALSGHPRDEPLLRWSNGAADLGTLGVTLFFVISGFLVSKSFTERRTFAAFAAARVLRIYPALITATLFATALVAMLGTAQWRDFLRDPQTHLFVATNSIGWHVEYYLPGAFVDNPFPRAINGSLWTIPVELRMYIGCAVVGALTLFSRRMLFNVVFIAAIALFSQRPDWFTPVSDVPPAWQLALAFAFALGAFAWVNRDWIPLSLPAAAIALLLLVINPADIVRGGLFIPLVAYVLLTFAVHPALRFASFNRIGDYSYGLYLYAFPIQQAVVHAQPGIGSVALFAEAFALTLVVAVCSWHGIERPTLDLKSHLRAIQLKPT